MFDSDFKIGIEIDSGITQFFFWNRNQETQTKRQIDKGKPCPQISDDDDYLPYVGKF